MFDNSWRMDCRGILPVVFAACCIGEFRHLWENKDCKVLLFSALLYTKLGYFLKYE